MYHHSQYRIITRFILLIFCFLLNRESNAFDSNTNRQVIPLGETEAFLGNAGVGRANDTGAVYYNPAGLAQLTDGRVSVTGNVYLKFDTKADSAFFLDSKNVGYEVSGFNTIPASYVASVRLNPDWVGALSVIVPSSIQLENRSPFTTPNTSSDIIQSSRVNELWIGFSAGRNINKQWSVGASLFGIEHQEADTVGIDLQFPAAPTTALITTQQQMTLNVVGLSAILGASYLASERLRLGLRMQTPFIEMSGHADTFSATHIVSSGTIATSGEDKQSAPANFRMPFDFTLGAAWKPEEWFTGLVDVSLQLGAHYTTIPGGSLLSDDVNLAPTVRYNAGIELYPTDWMPVRTGFFYNPSAVGTNQTDPGTQKENYYGVTFGVGFNSARVKTAFGGFYLWSKGHIMPAGAGGTLGEISSKGFGILLNTSYLL